MHQSFSDNQLVEQILQGVQAEKAYTLLMARYGKLLYSKLIRLLKNEDQAKDVLQNVYIKIWTQLSSFRNDASFYTWAYRIAHNEGLNELAKNKRKHTNQLTFSSIQFQDSTSFKMNVTEQEVSEWLHEAISTLPEKQALVFNLKYFEELKFSEISKITNTSEGALKANYHHASQKIETFLKEKLNLIQL